jgi:RecA/RadA recombinase
MAITDIFKGVDELNPDSAWLDENALSVVDEWIDTGCYALNAVCSGSLYKGVPKGRIIGFSGPSGCGKTMLINKIIGNFQRESDDHYAVIFDTEFALDKDSAASVGADPSRIKYYPIETVSDLKLQCTKLLDNIIHKGNEVRGKIIIGIDSLGNVAGKKESDDTKKGKDVADQGLRAKDIKSLLRALTFRAAKANAAIIFANHEYDNPNAMYPSLIKNQGGGRGPLYLASLLVQLSQVAKKKDKEWAQEEIIAAASSKGIVGKILHVLTAKNRFIPQYLAVDLWLNFKKGLSKYYGLFELAKDLGVIEGDRTFTFQGEKLGYEKNFTMNPDIWKMIMPELEKAVNKEFSYSNTKYEDLKEEVEKELEEMKGE